LTYLYKPASSKYKTADPILLIHPIGIGMSSWFWERLMEDFAEGPALYAVDLVGCGLAHGAAAWDPSQGGMSVPLGWAQACEALMHKEMVGVGKTNNLLPGLFATRRRYTVLAQGGLASVALLVAARNPETCKALVLTSPPTNLHTAVPSKELARNYAFFTGPLTAPLAFAALESRAAIRLFSNLFLFAPPGCDESWLDQTASEISPAARPPVGVFNAGFCQARSFAPELRELTQPLLILQGQNDKARNADRQDFYESHVSDCQVTTLPGKNVLPWESPAETSAVIRSFLGLSS
jgi:pimeloyl-ACP methyl ester carboxylesterase